MRFEPTGDPGNLIFPVQYTLWIPPGVAKVRGVVVHQHGCGEGSCRSGLTGAFDLHWQALAKQHDCALLSPSYEQPEGTDCQMWCDPRNGSGAAFLRALIQLGAISNHPEIALVPWALWGHSGGGHWAGGMALLYPERVVGAWLRSGVPLLEPNPERPSIKAYQLSNEVLSVPMMCNLGTEEGVTVKDGRFSGVWPANEIFFQSLRSRGALLGIAIDPFSSHDCGNQRYLAIPWLDYCLKARLPSQSGKRLGPLPLDDVWLAKPLGGEAHAAADFVGDPRKAAWLPNERIAHLWEHYVRDTEVPDITPPPAPSQIRLEGTRLNWNAEADLESGLAAFVIRVKGRELARLPAESKNRFGRPVFQGLQYSDTPTNPLVRMQWSDESLSAMTISDIRVIAINTVGLQSDGS